MQNKSTTHKSNFNVNESSRNHHHKRNRESVNIEFARSLSADELIAILQLELIRARSASPPKMEISIPVEIAHDIKYRIDAYAAEIGEVPRNKNYDRRRDQGARRPDGE